MPKLQYTTQEQIHNAFWFDHPQFSRAKHERSPDGHCDTRCAFVDYVDHMQKSGLISEALAHRVTL